MSEEEPAEVVRLSAFDQVLDLGLVEVSGRERLGRAEGGAERTGICRRHFCASAQVEGRSDSRRTLNSPVVAGDDDGAGTGRLVLDDLVRGLEALLVVGGAELVRERVLADAAEVGGRVGREDVLCVFTSGSFSTRRSNTGTHDRQEGAHLSSAGAVLGGTTGDVEDVVVLLQVVVAAIRTVNPPSVGSPLPTRAARRRTTARTSRSAFPRRGQHRWA